MLLKFATALLFKKSKLFLMPLFVVVFSVFLLFQQFSAFSVVKVEVDGFCRELEDVDLWIKSANLSFEDLSKVKKLPEVALASFLYKGSTQASSQSGVKKTCTLLGVDEATHLGLPNKVLYGSLRLKGGGDTAVLSGECAKNLFKIGNQKLKPGSPFYLDHEQMKVCGVTPEKRGFLVYTNFMKAKEVSAFGETMICIKASPYANISLLKSKIERSTGLKAYTQQEFSKLLFQNFKGENRSVSLFSIVITFSLLMALGIFGVIFIHYFNSQVKNYSILKAVGANQLFISSLLVIQGAIISSIGWGSSFIIYSSLQKIFSHSELFFPLSLDIIYLTICPLFVVSLGTALLISFKVKEVA